VPGARVIKRSSESDHALAERDRTGSFSGKVFFIRKDGTSFPTECSSVVLPGYEDPPLAFVIFRDISERVIAEAELRESEARLVRAQAVAHVGNWEMELPSKEMWASAEAKRIYGLPSDSPHFSHEIARSVPLEEEHPRLDAALDDLVTGRGPYDLEFRIRRAEDGAIRLIHSTADLAADESGVPTRVVGVIEDITERRRAEAALKESEELLLQSQKMEAVGQLAGGIAHDFNNLLTAIIGYSDLVLGDERVENLSAWDDVHEIKAAAERASALTRQILAFSRRQALRPRVTSLNDILIGMEPLLRRTLGEDIELVSRRQPDLGLTEVDTHQFERVLMNLAINSRDAMPLGGRLIFETCNIELDEDSCRTRPDVMPGSYVMLSVADTGVGMDPDTASHIFEPFFTTKGPGEGTGLGLSTVYGIVRQSGGSIEVFSEPGAGTMFKVLLPRATRPAGAPARVSPQETPAHGGETILIVEDDPSLRNLVSRVLKNLGYTTVVADDAEAAFAVLRDENRPVDLLLTDIVLPGSVRGDILAQRAIDMRPGLPVLHMSGYARDTSLQTGTLDEGINFIAKPFTPEMLGKMVREVLDRSPSRSA
jgi:two-component system, cell cycle sensor histidine kinase and response regulator CckA